MPRMTASQKSNELSEKSPRTDAPHPERTSRCQVLIVLRPGRPHLVNDFQRIGQYMRELDSGVRLKIVSDLPYTWLRPSIWSRPTLSVAMRRLLMFRPLRGPVYQCWPHTKIAEYRRLDAAGIAVPDWDVLTPRNQPDFSSLGRVVVVKPAAGGRGEGVRLMRSEEVRYQRPTNRSARRSHDLVVQRFIHTGPRTCYYRIVTFFGEVLTSFIVEAHPAQTPPPYPDEPLDRGSFDPASLYPNRQSRVMRLINDADILEFAKRVHREAFSDLPLLGIDIVREHDSGKLYVMEVNSGGSTWCFSTRSGRLQQEKYGFRHEPQFDGFRKAARILVEQARLHAW
jgi:hypothetical protein